MNGRAFPCLLPENITANCRESQTKVTSSLAVTESSAAVAQVLLKRKKKKIAASLSVAILKKKLRGWIFLGCDNHPLSFGKEVKLHKKLRYPSLAQFLWSFKNVFLVPGSVNPSYSLLPSKGYDLCLDTNFKDSFEV
ncbi:hypothetical protein CRYUN_Cryun36dG0087800 [Craigia yunnanensis]